MISHKYIYIFTYMYILHPVIQHAASAASCPTGSWIDMYFWPIRMSSGRGSDIGWGDDERTEASWLQTSRGCEFNQEGVSYNGVISVHAVEDILYYLLLKVRKLWSVFSTHVCFAKIQLPTVALLQCTTFQPLYPVHGWRGSMKGPPWQRYRHGNGIIERVCVCVWCWNICIKPNSFSEKCLNTPVSLLIEKRKYPNSISAVVRNWHR